MTYSLYSAGIWDFCLAVTLSTVSIITAILVWLAFEAYIDRGDLSDACLYKKITGWYIRWVVFFDKMDGKGRVDVIHNKSR